jgi:hypothetical protein
VVFKKNVKCWNAGDKQPNVVVGRTNPAPFVPTDVAVVYMVGVVAAASAQISTQQSVSQSEPDFQTY